MQYSITFEENWPIRRATQVQIQEGMEYPHKGPLEYRLACRPTERYMEKERENFGEK